MDSADLRRHSPGADPNLPAPSGKGLVGCPRCGGTHGDSPGGDACRAEADRVLSPLISRANLLRIRGQSDAAADECAALLRRAPGCAAVHALLGEIYQQQGRLEDARHWYQQAVELDPSSEADRARLLQIEEVLEARQQREQWEAVIAGRSQPVSTSLLVRESLQRVLTVAGAGVCGIILVAGTVVSLTDPGPPATALSDLPVPIVRGSRRQPNLPFTRSEQFLLQRLSPSRAPGGSQLVSVTIEPLTAEARLRVFVPWIMRERRTVRDFRERLVRDAYFWVSRARREDGSLASCHILLVGPSHPTQGAESISPLFGATLSAGRAAADPEDRDTGLLLRCFASSGPLYWAPELSGL